MTQAASGMIESEGSSIRWKWMLRPKKLRTTACNGCETRSGPDLHAHTHTQAHVDAHVHLQAELRTYFRACIHVVYEDCMI